MSIQSLENIRSSKRFFWGLFWVKLAVKLVYVTGILITACGTHPTPDKGESRTDMVLPESALVAHSVTVASTMGDTAYNFIDIPVTKAKSIAKDFTYEPNANVRVHFSDLDSKLVVRCPHVGNSTRLHWNIITGIHSNGMISSSSLAHGMFETIPAGKQIIRFALSNPMACEVSGQVKFKIELQ